MSNEIKNDLEAKEVVREVSVINDGRVEALQRTDNFMLKILLQGYLIFANMNKIYHQM